MNVTSPVPMRFRVPPDCGAPVPGFSPWKPDPTLVCGGVDEWGVVPPVVVLDELHAAATVISATAPIAAPNVRGNRLATASPVLQVCSAKVVRGGRTCGPPPRWPCWRPATAMANQRQVKHVAAYLKYRECHGMPSSPKDDSDISNYLSLKYP